MLRKDKLWQVGLFIIMIPILLVAFPVAGISCIYLKLRNRKEYKQSPYYQKYKLPFNKNIFTSPEYRCYNGIQERNLPVDYVRQESNGLEYFIFRETLFLFPDFDRIDYDLEKSDWQVGDNNGTTMPFEQAFENLRMRLDPQTPALPIQLLVERRMFPMQDLSKTPIPQNVFVLWSYDTPFESEESLWKWYVPQTTKELYEMMSATPELCGTFQLMDDDAIAWNLYDKMQIIIVVESQECCLGIQTKLFGKVPNEIIHWHPENNEIYNEICKMGSRGNVLVIRTFLTGASVLYMGKEETCPYTADSKRLFGKLYYLKAV